MPSFLSFCSHSLDLLLFFSSSSALFSWYLPYFLFCFLSVSSFLTRTAAFWLKRVPALPWWNLCLGSIGVRYAAI